MDNILKLLLGVLGVAGLLAMLTPSGIAPTPPEPTTAETPPPAEQVNTQLPPEQPVTSAGDEYNFTIGEPTIDGKPIVSPDSPAPMDNNLTPSEPQPGDNGGFAPAGDTVAAPAQTGSDMD